MQTTPFYGFPPSGVISQTSALKSWKQDGLWGDGLVTPLDGQSPTSQSGLEEADANPTL